MPINAYNRNVKLSDVFRQLCLALESSAMHGDHASADSFSKALGEVNRMIIDNTYQYRDNADERGPS